jgi:GT2 family glycosyltransferase
MPALSIVIPTHNRAEVLRATLMALANQTLSVDDFEVIVVADGCLDGTASVVRSLGLPFRFHCLDQPPSGAAAARNQGADAASAPLLLFLDDDMKASPGFLEAHLGGHSRHRDTVVLGYFAPARGKQSEDIFMEGVNTWWGERFSEMCKESHRFAFQDLFSGNVSLSKDLFLRAGRFDERFIGRAGEDFELAVRLLKHRARFRFIRAAACVHHDIPTLESFVGRAFAEGRGHVLIAKKHPETFPALPLSKAVGGGPWISVGWGFRLRPWTVHRIKGLLLAFLKTARIMKARRLLTRFLRLVQYCAYWRGVLHELITKAALQRFLQDMPLKPSEFVQLEVDLETDLERIEEILTAHPTDAVGLLYGEKPIGYIPAQPAAEPLRSEHLIPAIIHGYATKFLMALRSGNPLDMRISMGLQVKQREP